MKFARVCSEAELPALAREVVEKLRAAGAAKGSKKGPFPGALITLEGEMGAGKSTFARRLLEAWGVVQPPEGSPTFAIAHEYEAAGAVSGAPSSGDDQAPSSVVHIDFYRIRDPEEIDEAGISAIFWERPGAVILTEWLSMFPGFEAEALARPGIPVARIQLLRDVDRDESRRISVEIVS